MTYCGNDNMRPFTFVRRADPLLDAALEAAKGNRSAATMRLLEAININEGDSDLGGVIDAMLKSGPFYQRRSRDEHEDAAIAADTLDDRMHDLVCQWRLSSEHLAEGAA